MRKILLFLLTLLCISAYSQTDSINTSDKQRRLDLVDQLLERKSTRDIDRANPWAVGAGLSNFIMHGDLRSLGTGSQGNFWNFGAYAYVNRMFNPILGLEVKLSYWNNSGGAQYFSDVYNIVYLNNTQITNDLFFDGRSYAAELNGIISLSNLYKQFPEKWHVAAYLGVGYQQYNSRLQTTNPDGSTSVLIDFGLNPARNNVNEASSIFLTTQLGIKYRLSRRFDLELRPSWYFNYEDHLDAAISNKQDWETFFVTHLGVTFKFGRQKYHTIWGGEEIEPGKSKSVSPTFFDDDDNDGVVNQMDREPNTPKGVKVYGNGVSVDSDDDGIPDYQDDCRFEKGPISNQGCPLTGDRDKDGVPDKDDKCIDVRGLELYVGCPDAESLRIKQMVEVLSYSKNIYFNTDSNKIRSAYYYTMLDEVAKIMLKNKNVMFSIYGYTDDRASDQYNQALSERRAQSARKYLIAQGIEPDRIIAKGFGEINPKFDNKTIEGRQLNRRVEIKSIGPYEQKKRVILDKNKE